MAQTVNYDKFRYFSHDADMRNDIKVKALRKRFGNDGYAVWNYILETLTDSEDWEIELTALNTELYASDFDIAPDRLTEIIEYSKQIGLLQSSDNRIFSVRHQERLQQVIDKKNERSEIARKAIEVRWSKRGNTDTTVTDTDTSVLHTNTDVIRTNTDELHTDTIIEEKEKKETKSKETKIDYKEIVTLWNETCLSLPKVRQLNENRRSKIKTRLSEFGCKTADEIMAFLKDLFSRCQSSRFLCGDNAHNWTASFDWVFENSSNWVKVIEGNYDSDRGQNKARTGSNVTLGVGEYITQDGRRTYGSGKANIPMSAPARPSERYAWDAQSQQWILV